MDRVLDVFPEHRETIVHLKLDKERQLIAWLGVQ